MLRHTALVLAGTLFIFSGCGTASSGTPRQAFGTGGGGSGGANSGGANSGGANSGGANSGNGGSGGSSTPDAGGGTGGSAGGAPGPITCSAPSTAYAKDGSACGKWRWGVKTGTDKDRDKVNMTPEVTTIQAMRSLATPTVNYCYRQPPELKTYELRNVTLKFEALETDSDYHLIASDASGNTMIVEVPYPPCVGQNSCQSGTPWLCEITHARAAVDAKNPGAVGHAQLGVGSVVGVGFFDTYELNNTYKPAGMAPNGIELHPVLGICFGTNCDPLKG